MAAALSVEERLLRPVPSRPATAADARGLLALLAWNYAQGLYSSKELHDRLRLAPAGDFWKSGLPDVADICRFRQENRMALETCLRAGLHFLAEQKIKAGVVTQVNPLKIASEATRRLTTAMFIDDAEYGACPPQTAPGGCVADDPEPAPDGGQMALVPKLLSIMCGWFRKMSNIRIEL
jgi:hypothetical protein